jgi:hypothetical protein
VSFNVRLDRIFPGMGQPLRNDAVFLQSGIALSGTAQQSSPIPASGVLSIPTSAGRLRIKIYNGGGTTPALTDIVVTAGDGTNNITLGGGILHPTVAVTLSATSWLEFEFEYIIDFATTAGGGGGSVGQLLASVGGANQFAIKTTMSGTAPTASMDLELCPLI